MYRFLLRPGWIAGIVGCIAAAIIMTYLARWQLHRLEDKQAINASIVAARTAQTQPVDAVLPATAKTNPTARDEWRRVSVTGTYLADEIVLQRGRTNQGEVGFEMLVPLQSDEGSVVLVDRGWVQAPPEADKLPALPDIPSGQLTVTGWVRLSASDTGSTTTLVSIQGTPTVRAISTGRLAAQLSLPLRGGYVVAREESPKPAGTITRAGLPDLDEGPHLSYAVQWYLFSVMTLVGFGVFARREARDRRAAELGPADPDNAYADADNADPTGPDDPRVATTPTPMAPTPTAQERL